MEKSIASVILVTVFASQALAQGDLHVKGKIKSDSLSNSGYLLIYADSTGTLDTLPAGLPGQVLISNGSGKPYWGTTGTGVSILYADITNVGTDANTVQKVLGSYTMPGNTLSTDGMWIEIEAFGSIVSTTNNTYVRLKFGGDILFEDIQYDGSPDNLKFGLYARIYRKNNNQQKSLLKTFFTAESGNGYLKSHSKDLSANVTIEVTGQNGSGSQSVNNIVLEGLMVRLIK